MTVLYEGAMEIVPFFNGQYGKRNSTAQTPVTYPMHDFMDKHAYDLAVVSVGPFHYKKALVQGHKLQFLFSLTPYQSKEERKHRLQHLAEAMKKLEGRARQCHSETFEDISTDFFCPHDGH
ncbi:hypothetical protein CFP56_003127 [Quercus suber]|uniref:Uncharacterized protein n=1 Tax=Quercus suber TaxID=58331 RepID=A0AAW0LCF7_QUESU